MPQPGTLFRAVLPCWHWFGSLVRLLPTQLFRKSEVGMEIDKERIQTQEETGELAPMDQIEERVDAEMKKLEGEAKKQVADGLQDKALAREGERLRKEGEQELKETKER